MFSPVTKFGCFHLQPSCLSDVDVASCAPYAVGFEPHESCFRTIITTTLLKRDLRFSMYGMNIARLLLTAFVHRKVCGAVVCVRRAETKVLFALDSLASQFISITITIVFSPALYKLPFYSNLVRDKF